VTEELVRGYREPFLNRGRRRAILRAAAQLDVSAGADLARRLPEIGVPALVVWGDEDPIVAVGMGERLAHDLPSAELVILSGIGHLPPEEAPDHSLEPVLAFLSSL
jgi:pimeloyl-ACP methyl ester carboxylesterase